MPKCKYCGAIVKKGEAFVDDSNSKRSAYYCNEEHYYIMTTEEKYVNDILAILSFISNTKVTKRTMKSNITLKKIRDTYGSNGIAYNSLKVSIESIFDGINNNGIIIGQDRLAYALAVMERQCAEGYKLYSHSIRKHYKIDNSVVDVEYKKKKKKNENDITHLIGVI